MTTWDEYLADTELVAVGEWVDELAADPNRHPEDVANTIIEDGVHAVPESMFDHIVEYVEARRAAPAAGIVYGEDGLPADWCFDGPSDVA